MTKQLLILSATLLFSCTEPEPEQKPKTLEAFADIGYNLVQSMKSGDKEKFFSLLDPKIYDATPKDQIEQYFDIYKKAVDNYELPPYDKWKKEDHLWVTFDTINQNFIFGFPFQDNPTGILEGYFKIKFTEENKIISIFLNQTPDPKLQPDSLFPPLIKKLDLTFDKLSSITFFRLPGHASDNPTLKHVFIKRNEFEPINSELKQIIDTLNSCSILEIEKSFPSHEPNTDDLKRIELVFKEPLYVISIMNTTMLDKYTEVQAHIGHINTQHTYQISDSDKSKLMRLLTEHVPRHIK